MTLIDKQKCSRFRKDGRNWRIKKDGKTARDLVPLEAHEKLKGTLPVGQARDSQCCSRGLACMQAQLVLLGSGFGEVAAGRSGVFAVNTKGQGQGSAPLSRPTHLPARSGS